MINTANYIPDHISNDGQYPRNIRQKYLQTQLQ